MRLHDTTGTYILEGTVAEIIEYQQKMSVKIEEAVTEFEQQQKIERSKRTKEGLQKAKENGVNIGRPKSVNATNMKKIIRLKKSGYSVNYIADQFDISRATVYRIIGRGGR